MIRTLSDAADGTALRYDLCIIGSGPAGGTLAAELASSGLRVCVLESGREKPSAAANALRATRSEGIAIKAWSRERVLGGASTTWAGLSSPFDPIDFAAHPERPLSGWPIARDELLPYYAQACERYRFAPLEFFERAGFAALRERGQLQPQWTSLDEKVFLACADPQDFGKELRAKYTGESLDLWLEATVLRLEAQPGTRRIAAAAVVDGRGRSFRCAARAFVLATGGIENARLLLVSRDLDPQGLGNRNDQVGRYLMNHPKNYHGRLLLARPVESAPYYFGCLFEGFAGYAGLRLSEAEQRSRGLLNSYVRFEPLFPWTDSVGVESLVTLVKRTKVVLRAFQRRHRDQLVELRDYSETGDDSVLQNERKDLWSWFALCGNVLRDARRVVAYAWYRVVARKRPRIRAVRLRNFMEMEPHPDNRVLLAQERDVLGQPLPLVRHRCTELDQRSLIALHERLEEEFVRAGIGRLESDLARADPWPIDQDASHHMGTTRMGADPASSVVDRDLRVHAVENVWCAGASVFPTSGCANPTFTLVALSIRLARELERRLGAQADSGAAR